MAATIWYTTISRSEEEEEEESRTETKSSCLFCAQYPATTGVTVIVLVVLNVASLLLIQTYEFEHDYTWYFFHKHNLPRS